MRQISLFLCLFWMIASKTYGQVSLVKDIDPGPGGGTDEFAPPGVILGEHYIFPATTLQNGNEVWISDGTEEGTKLLKDIIPGAASSQPRRFFQAFGKVYFNANTTAEGRELWVTDGTEAGTQMVMDIEPGTAGSDPLFGAVFDGSLFFAATSGGDREIWWLDSILGPSLFMNLNPASHSNPRRFTVIGEKMYFAASEHPVSGNDEDEPYVTDGTPGGTVKLYDVTINNHGAGVREFVGLGNDVFFAASTNGGVSPGDHEIFKTDGTPGGTILLQDLLGSQWLTPYGSSVYFFYDSDFYRIQADGSYFQVASINNDDEYHLDNPIVQFNDFMYIPANTGTGSTGVELFTSKGGVINTNILKDIYPGDGSSLPAFITALEDRVLFVASSTDFDRELYVTDGTSEGTTRVVDLNQGDGGSNPASLVVGDDIVYFYAFTPETGTELYKYDLNPSATNETVNTSFRGVVYPQPASKQPITVEWSMEDGWLHGELFTSSGEKIAKYPDLPNSRLIIATENLLPGVYFLSLGNDTLRTITRVLIQ